MLTDILRARSSGPSGQTLALEAAELQRLAVGAVLARILSVTRVDDLRAVGAGEAGAAQTFGCSEAG